MINIFALRKYKGLKVGLLLMMANSATISGSAFAQSAVEQGFGMETGTDRLKELFVAFHALDGEISSGIRESISDQDLSVIDYAIYYAPHFQEALNMQARACEYFNSVNFVDVEVNDIIALLEEASRTEYAMHETHLEMAYQSLSSTAKSRIDLIAKSQFDSIAKMKMITFDYKRLADEVDRPEVIQHVAQVCDRLPIAASMLDSNGRIKTSESFINPED